MRRVVATAALAVMLGSGGWAAGDISGRWQAEVPAPGNTTAFEYLDLVVRDGTVTGTLTNAVGGVGQLHDGTWDGATLKFWVPWDPGRLEATGTEAGATLALTFKTSQWQGKRIFSRAPARTAGPGAAGPSR
jgi:hypothetical protein